MSRRVNSARAWLTLLAALAVLLALAPALAHAQGSGPDTVSLVWTAPGDDGTVGTATAYELRMSTSGPVNASTWSGATVLNGLPAPRPAGSRDHFVVRGLTRGTTYYFAIRAVDDQGNWSAVSNSLTWDWRFDTAPPAAPSGGRGVRESETAVRVSWSPNSEPDLVGYSVYRSTSASGPFAPLNGAPVNGTQFVDSTIPTDATQVWYQLTAVDDSGNESARSATFSVSMTTSSATSQWTLQAAYPNPSRGSSSVSFPVIVPGAGAQGARLEITDAAAHMIRRIDLGTLIPGAQTVTWDGRNQAGRTVSPGVYTAWLIAGGSRNGVKLVRQP